jgi:O-acetyl-ADP-ribose deacetylase (regulator of RNase III)
MKIYNGDITKIECQAIVNAANTSLMGGGGVDGAIHRAGGSKILEECKKIRASQGGCKVGYAVITTAGNLPAHRVIHTVGPIWNNKGNERELLKNCYKSVFKLALENNINELAIPNISTGVYKFPKELAAEIAIEATKDFLDSHPNFKQIIFVCFDMENYKIYEKLLNLVD